MKDEELFAQFFPISKPIVPEVKVARPAQSELPAKVAGTPKRGISSITALEPIRKKSKIPALASLAQLSAIAAEEGAQKKRVLVTREKLRSGLRDPKGLLNLVGPSTNALERTKKLELLKSSGLLFNLQKKSFSDKLTAAILSLELGLAGRVADMPWDSARSVGFQRKKCGIPVGFQWDSVGFRPKGFQSDS